ncbi:MAG: Quinone oxidoreductase [Candidatus Midichloriaceae bacterium]|jgi:NADPH2:quinone reductase|nr:Quinone oxidoreductase [Candidatus Midichloriaceae bacterium]
MAQAVILESFGKPEVMKLVDMSLSAPGDFDVQVENIAIEVNFIDLLQRSGAHPIKSSSKIPGVSAVGKIVKMGSAVKSYKLGDIVGYTTFDNAGTYCTARNVHNQLLVNIPPEIPIKTMAACFYKGIAAQYLCCRTFIARPEISVLVHVASGGVGGLIAGWCKSMGAQVIGTIGSEEKRKAALASGCDIVINYSEEDWVSKVLKATNNIGVNVVYNGIGGDTFNDSLSCLMPRGTMVLFGNASGDVAQLDMKIVSEKSLFFTRPSITHYKRNRMELLLGFNELSSKIIDGSLKVTPPIEFKLSEAADAHKLLESRQNKALLILVP